MKEGQELAGLMDMASLLTATRSYQETIEVIVSKSAKVLKSDRACLIVKTKEGRLRVESSFPTAAYGIGIELTSETGEMFLNEVLAAGSHMYLRDFSNEKMKYMNPLVRRYNITSLLVAPLYYEDCPVGILILDFIEGHEMSEECLSKVQYLSHIIAVAVKNEQNRQEHKDNAHLFVLGENIARVSHVIGNKLMIIKGFSEQVYENLSSDKYDLVEARDNIGRVIAAARDIEVFVRSIKDFSNPKEFKPEKINVNDFLEDSVLTLSKSGLNFVRFNFDLDFDIPSVSMDKSFMADCIQDVIENAVQAMARTVTIKSRYLAEEKKALISISNDGLEIDPSFVDKIFDLFKTTREGGTGLGLANVKAIVERFHGGKVEVDSDDKVTEFRIYLPSE